MSEEPIPCEHRIHYCYTAEKGLCVLAGWNVLLGAKLNFMLKCGAAQNSCSTHLNDKADANERLKHQAREEASRRPQ